MALDQTTLLQLLTQLQGGGAPPVRPTSGLEEPSLSGLKLGEQGMGLGGGGSLLGGSPGLGGGAEGPGLDFLTLLNQLTQGAGTASATGQSLLEGIAPSSLGFGAGGQLQPQQGGVPQGIIGQAVAGGGQSAATALALLKEAIGLGKTLLGTSKTASPSGGTGGTADILRGTAGLEEFPTGAGGTIAPGGGTFSERGNILPPIPGLGGLPEFPAGAVGLPGPGGGTFSAGGNVLPGLPSLGPGGATSGSELAAQFGAQGGGEFGLANLGGGGAGLFSPGNLLPGLGVLGNVGSGILGLTEGNVGGGAGTLGGTAAGLGLGAALAPETFGLSLLLGGLGGSAGGLLGSLFGGLFGRPSIFEARRRNVGPTAQAGESRVANALTQGLDATPGIQSVSELLAALGVPTPDTFGGPRNPVAVGLGGAGPLAVPKDLSEFLLGGPTKNVGPLAGIDFEFNPNRISAGAELVTPAILQRFLGRVNTDPSLLNLIQGSGDVTFQNQAASEALAARVRADAQNAIRRFLGLPLPAAGPSGPPEPAGALGAFGVRPEEPEPRGGA